MYRLQFTINRLQFKIKPIAVYNLQALNQYP